MKQADSERLTRVGPGTPMGELLRRYWQPIAAVAELEDHAKKPIRLLGEDLLLYRDGSGHHGLIDRHCPHRGTDLAHGYVEECGLRCSYHGWKFEHTGRCVAQPFEEAAAPDGNFKDRIRIKAYPIESLGGLLWAYLGPAPAPLLPRWEPFTWKNGFVQIVYADVGCNWLQCQENSCDPVHFEWLHANRAAGNRSPVGAYSPAHVKVQIDELEWGFAYRRLLADIDEEHPLWTIGRVCLHPNALFTGDHFEWRLPVDDENTRSITWSFSKVPREREPYEQRRIPYWTGPVFDAAGAVITSHVMNQDFAAWMGQGVIADRTREHLGHSDRGVISMRKRLLDDLARIERGEDPSGLLRDPARNHCVELPTIGRLGYRDGMPMATLDKVFGAMGYRFPPGYILQAGQPEDVRREYEAAMGRPIAR